MEEHLHHKEWTGKHHIISWFCILSIGHGVRGSSVMDGLPCIYIRIWRAGKLAGLQGCSEVQRRLQTVRTSWYGIMCTLTDLVEFNSECTTGEMKAVDSQFFDRQRLPLAPSRLVSEAADYLQCVVEHL